MKKIKLFIADDHAILIDGLIRMFSMDPHIEVVGRASNVQQLIETVTVLAKGEKSPDVVLLDIRLNAHDPRDKSGLEAIQKIKNISPAIKVLIMTGFNARSFFSEAIQQMADGYLSKDNEQQVFTDAVKRLARGEKVFIADLEYDVEDTGEEYHQISELTEREREIVCHLTEGKTSTEIAKLLFIAPVTVDKHRQNILNKLKMHNVAQLVAFAVRNKICR